MNIFTRKLKTKTDLLCEKYHIRNYSVNPDGSIDVDGDVNMNYSSLDRIPLVFNNVSGNFNCWKNKLTSLIGGPVRVGGNYNCNHNKILTLEGAPDYIGDMFECSHNSDLVSTYSGDRDIEIVDTAYLLSNKLPYLMELNLEHIKLILKYQRHFFIWNDDLTLNEENFQILIEEIKDGLE